MIQHTKKSEAIDAGIVDLPLGQTSDNSHTDITVPGRAQVCDGSLTRLRE